MKEHTEYQVVFLDRDGVTLYEGDWFLMSEGAWYITYCLNGESLLGDVWEINTR